MHRIDTKLGLAVGLVVILALATTKLVADTKENSEAALYGGLLPSQSNSLSRAVPGKTLIFPKDHGSHPNYAIEWWYFTANLSANEQNYGVQYTLFRFNRGNKQANAWANGQMYMAHASLHMPDKHYFSERFARGGQAHVGITPSPFSLRMDDWLWQADNEDLLPATLSLELVSPASANELAQPLHNRISVDLELSAYGPLVLQGDAGFSQKSMLGTHASYYYSQPFIRVDGMLIEQVGADQQTYKVSGQGWFDHEWTSQLLDQQTLGWDWFSIHLDGGEKLMAFRMRLRDNPNYVTGTLIAPNGTTTTLDNGTITINPLAYEIDTDNNTQYPTQWSLAIPQREMAITISPQKPKQWNRGRFLYYEGAIEITGTHEGKGFMELTGY